MSKAAIIVNSRTGTTRQFASPSLELKSRDGSLSEKDQQTLDFFIRET